MASTYIFKAKLKYIIYITIQSSNKRIFLHNNILLPVAKIVVAEVLPEVSWSAKAWLTCTGDLLRWPGGSCVQVCPGDLLRILDLSERMDGEFVVLRLLLELKKKSWAIEQKGITKIHGFVYSFSLYSSLLKIEGRRKGE